MCCAALRSERSEVSALEVGKEEDSELIEVPAGEYRVPSVGCGRRVASLCSIAGSGSTV